MNGITLWLKVIKRQLSANRSILIALVVCLSLLIFIIQTVFDISSANKTLAYHTYGSQQGFIFNCSDQLISAIENDPAIAEFGQITQAGFISNPKLDNSGVVSIGSFDDQSREMSHLELQEGRWPLSSSEIVLEENSILILRLQASVGDTIELNLIRSLADNSDETVVASKAYTLVGILKNYSYMQYHPAPSSTVQTPLPGAIVAHSAQAVSITATVQLSGNIPMFRFFRNLADQFDLSIDQYYLNTAIYEQDAPLQTVEGDYQKNLSSYFYEAENSIGYNGQSTQLQNAINLIIVLLICLTLFVTISTLLIYSKKQKASVFSLRLAGTTPIQVIYYTACQVSLYLIILLPIGVLLGLTSSLIVAKRLLANNIPYFQYTVHFTQLAFMSLSYVLILTFVFMITSYMSLKSRPLTNEPKGSMEKRQLHNRQTGKHESKPVLMWSLHSFRENRLALTSVIFTLVLCFSAMLISSFLVMQFKQSSVRVYQYDAVLSNTSLPISVASISSFDIPAAYGFGFDQADLKEIQTTGNIKTIYNINRFQINLLGSQRPESRQQLASLDHMDIEAVHVNAIEQINKDKDTYGYTWEDRIYTGTLIGVDSALLTDLNQYVSSGTIDSEALNLGKHVILISRTGNTTIEAGDTLTLTQIIYTGTANKPAQSWSRKDVQVQVSAIIDLSASGNTYPNIFGQGDALVWGLNAVEIFGLTPRITDLYINLSNPKLTTEIQSEMIQLDTLYPGSSIYIQSEVDRQTKANGNVLLGIAYGILLILFCFAIFSLYSFSQSLAERNRRVIGALRAGGFSFDLMQKMKLIESGVMIVLAFIIANVASVGIMIALIPWQGMPLFLREMKTIITSYPLTAVILIVPLMIITAWIFQLMPIRRLYKKPVCELLRDN